MKKVLFLASLAAIAMTSCTSESNEYVGNGPEQKEIAFMPVAQKATRGAYSVITTAFPTDNTMEVKAYQTQPSTGTYFEKCTFAKGGGETWAAGKYWPLSEAKINFFAVSGYNVAAADITIANELASATVEYKATGNTSNTEYSAATQSDIMYAFGRGSVTKAGNVLTTPASVPMQFKHALALVDFEVKGNSATEAAAITVNSITLKGATYNGTLTLTNTNAATVSDAVTTAVSWAPGSSVATQDVPGISANTSISTTMTRIGNGLMVIPGTGFTSFMINYSMNGTAYNFEYTPDPVVSSTTANNKYTYQITFTLNEIQIAPTVAVWTNTDDGVTVH